MVAHKLDVQTVPIPTLRLSEVWQEFTVPITESREPGLVTSAFKLYGQVVLGIYEYIHQGEEADQEFMGDEEFEEGGLTYQTSILICKHIGTEFKSTDPACFKIVEVEEELMLATIEETILAYCYHQEKVFVSKSDRIFWSSDPNRQYFSRINLEVLAFDSKDAKLESICQKRLNCEDLSLELLPKVYDNRLADKRPLVCWFAVCQDRLFAFIQPNSLQTCVWIHCYYKKDFHPIAGSKHGHRGLYAFDSSSVISRSPYSDGGCFLRKVIYPNKVGESVELVRRLYLTW